MSTRIEKSFEFGTAIHYNDSFNVNWYNLELGILVETENYTDQQLAMERIIYFIENIIQHSILVDGTDIDTIQMYKQCGMKVCEVPGEPHDQIFSMILLNKLNAIMEHKMYITDMTLESTLSAGVRYGMLAEQAEAAMTGNYWWNKASLSITNIPSDAKIVNLFVKSEWDELALEWEQSA